MMDSKVTYICLHFQITKYLIWHIYVGRAATVRTKQNHPLAAQAPGPALLSAQDRNPHRACTARRHYSAARKNQTTTRQGRRQLLVRLVQAGWGIPIIRRQCLRSWSPERNLPTSSCCMRSKKTSRELLHLTVGYVQLINSWFVCNQHRSRQ